MNLRQARYLQQKFPELGRFQLSLTEQNAEDILDFYHAFIPLIDQKARATHERVLLDRLRTRTEDDFLKSQATREIAISDLHNGIPDRAKILASDPVYREELARQTKELEQQYGAALLTESWPNAERGETLRYYFEHNIEKIKGKSILHFSPEAELRSWIKEHEQELGVKYLTSNIAGSDVDLNNDLTHLELPDAEYDLIICHRVLEHVLDDAAAMRELYRVLKPGGTLQISVPQAVHVADTNEWIIPDTTHHGHVRQYGQDFISRLEAAGFLVAVDDWLLSQSREELLAHGAYPLRMYNAAKK